MRNWFLYKERGEALGQNEGFRDGGPGSHWPKPRFLCGVRAILAWVMSLWWDCLMFRGIPGLYLPDAGSNPIGVTINVSRCCHMFCGPRITPVEKQSPNEREEFRFWSVDLPCCRHLVRVLNANWRSKKLRGQHRGPRPGLAGRGGPFSRILAPSRVS